MGYREEKDAMGTVRLPEEAYYGAQTARAIGNFPISGLRLPPAFIRALALIKRCAARVNGELGVIDAEIAGTVAAVAGEVMNGAMADQFPVDVFQTGSGTSTNMNMNEVLAGRANEILTGKRGGRSPVHPNDHVNACQSSNDVIPSAIHIAAMQEINEKLLPALMQLNRSLSDKAEAFKDIRKIGRTHLQDATPMTLGDEFSGYARQAELGVQRASAVYDRLTALPLGGTAVGTGLNAHPDFAAKTIALISTETGLPFREAENHFEAQACKDAVLETSGMLRTVAISLSKIANDLRWLASGPRCGLGEIRLPALQPGSSIMPGKVNPVIPEAVLQVAAQVAGNDAAIMTAARGGVFELNVMMPVMAYNLLQSAELLASAAGVFAEKCIDGVVADAARCAGYIEKSLALATLLVPHLGYDRASEVAKTAYATDKTVKEVVAEKGLLPDDLIRKLFEDI